MHLKMTCFYYFHVILFLLLTTTNVTAIDTIYSNETLKDGDTIVSAGQVFELGFFSPWNSSLRYLGIWYKSIPTVTIVWVANREAPLVHPTGFLKLNANNGTLQLLNMSNNLVWSSEPVKNTSSNMVAQLLDSGNLVIKDATNDELIIWQSFDHPGDTLLPGMKLGVDLVTGIKRELTSWKRFDDPSPGPYTVTINVNGYPQLYIMKESGILQRLGSWNGGSFSGMDTHKQRSFNAFEFVFNNKEIYYKYTPVTSSYFTRMILNPEPSFKQFFWMDQSQSWELFMETFSDNCEHKGSCGSYKFCNNNNLECECLEGFEPKMPQDEKDGSHGCKHKSGENGNKIFNKFSNMKLPDTQDSWFNNSMSLEECEDVCIRNVSCTAYANTDIRGGGSGCIQWFSELIDIREAPPEDVSGQDIYIRVSTSNKIGMCICES